MSEQCLFLLGILLILAGLKGLADAERHERRRQDDRATEVILSAVYDADTCLGREHPLGELADRPPEFSHSDALHADELGWMN